METAKPFLHYLAIIIFFGWAILLAFRISKRTGKNIFWHLLGLPGTKQNMTTQEITSTFIVIVITLALLVSSTDLHRMAMDAKAQVETKNLQQK
jgi:archaellum biogenesis protein FlaJ (TadC family)